MFKKIHRIWMLNQKFHRIKQVAPVKVVNFNLKKSKVGIKII